MVKTKSTYDLRHESDGKRILVTRYWPRGRTRHELAIDKWARTLAPSAQLVDEWNHNMISWAQYKARYSAEMRLHDRAIKSLAQRARQDTVTLLSFEHEENPYSQRHILKEIIERELTEPTGQSQNGSWL